MTRKGFRNAVVDNPVYAEILRELSRLERDGQEVEAYASSPVLQENLGKGITALATQLRRLDAAGYLEIQHTRGKAVRYSVNYERIARSLFSWVLDEIDSSNELSFEDLETEGLAPHPIIDVSEELPFSIEAACKNQYLHEYLKNILADLEEGFTLADVFQRICTLNVQEEILSEFDPEKRDRTPYELDIEEYEQSQRTLRRAIEQDPSFRVFFVTLVRLHRLIVPGSLLNLSIRKEAKLIVADVLDQFNQ